MRKTLVFPYLETDDVSEERLKTLDKLLKMELLIIVLIELNERDLKQSVTSKRKCGKENEIFK